MSKIKIVGHASGTGILTIAAPNTNEDRTITIPDVTGTLLDSGSDLPAANLTGTIADARFPATLPAISGANLTGISSVGGATGVDFNDNVKAQFGTSDDLQIYHDGSHSRIEDTGTGNLYIKASNNLLLRSATNEDYLDCTANGAVRLYYDNSVKLATTAVGVAVTGDLTVSADVITAGGSEANPSYSFSGDSNTGMWRPDSDTLAISTGGAERMRMRSDGTLIVGSTAVFGGWDSQLYVRQNDGNGYSAVFSNDGNDANRWGIAIACGSDAPSTTDNYPIKFMDGDGTEVGTITFDNAGVSYNGQNTAKAWVRFNGSGTPAITDSHNVSSITDHGTGNYSVNFSNSLSQSHWASSVSTNNTGNQWCGSTNEAAAASYYKFQCWDDVKNANGKYDPTWISAIIFGD